MQQHCSKYFARRPYQPPSPDPRVGVKRSKFNLVMFTLVNVHVDLLVFRRIVGTSKTGVVDIGVNTV